MFDPKHPITDLKPESFDTIDGRKEIIAWLVTTHLGITNLGNRCASVHAVTSLIAQVQDLQKQVEELKKPKHDK